MKQYPGIVIDYGHGKQVAGKYYVFTDHNDFEVREWITNRMTAARVIRLCVLGNRPHYDCVADKIWTREEVLSPDWGWERLCADDIPLSTRTNRANQRPDWIVLSLHSNAVGYTNKGPSQSARGGVMYTSPGQTDADPIAQSIHNAFVRAFGSEPVHMRSGDTRDGDNDMEAKFWMVRKTKGPAVLGEMLFFVNIDDARYLMSSHGQDVIAHAYYGGVAAFISPMG